VDYSGRAVTPPDAERRRGPRIEARLDVAYEDRERQVFLAASDLSEQGVFLRDPEPPDQGARARLVLALPNGALLRVHGHVMRQQRDGFAFRFDWDATGEPDRLALRNFIAQFTGDSR